MASKNAFGVEKENTSKVEEVEMIQSGTGAVFISIFNYSEIRFTLYKDYLVFSLKAESFQRKGGENMEVIVSIQGNDILVRNDISSLQISVKFTSIQNSLKRIEKFEGNALVLEYIGSINVKVRKEKVYHEVYRIFIDGKD
jgi:hypothetical protein